MSRGGDLLSHLHSHLLYYLDIVFDPPIQTLSIRHSSPFPELILARVFKGGTSVYGG